VEILSFIMSIIFVVVMGVITQKILENKGYKLSVEWVLLVLFLPPSAPSLRYLWDQIRRNLVSAHTVEA